MCCEFFLNRELTFHLFVATTLLPGNFRYGVHNIKYRSVDVSLLHLKQPEAQLAVILHRPASYKISNLSAGCP